MSKHFLFWDEVSKKVGYARDPPVTLKELDTRWFLKPHFVERWEWITAADAAAKKRWFYNRFMGRTGSIWKSEYAELNPDNWSLPVYEAGANTLQPSPWNNAIHLRNSKDGTALDEVYISPKITMQPPAVLAFDAIFPAFNTTNYPNGTYISIGFEVNSGGYVGRIYELQIWSDGTNVTVTIKSRFGVDRDWTTEDTSTDIKTLITTDQWKNFILVLLPNAFILYQNRVKIAEIPITQDFTSYVIPYFANESTPIVEGVKIGQFQVYQAELFKVMRKEIDVASISAGGYAETGVLTLPKEVAVQVSVTYGASITASPRVYFLACNRDGTVIDTERTDTAFAYFDVPYSANTTRVKTVNLDCLPKYLRIRVRNQDTANALGAVKLFLHEAW